MNTTLNTQNAISALPDALNQSMKILVSPMKSLYKNALNQRTKTELNMSTAAPHITATLIQTELETHDTKSYFFKADKALKQYRAGAHINIEFRANNKIVKRTYTLSSSPKPSYQSKVVHEFSITVKRVHDGLASNWLFDNLVTGNTIKVSQPQGSFVLPFQPAGKLLMISAGSGITPLMSMLRYLSESGNRSDIIFLHYAQSDNDIIFHHELQKIAATKDNISTHFSVEQLKNKQTTTHSKDYKQGRISKAQLTTIIPDLLEREVYLCGPQPFMKATVSILNDIKFKPSQLHLENFTANLNTATQLGYSAKLNFSSLTQSIQSSPSRTILEEAEAAGLKPTSACRTGICKSCRCKKTTGTTVNLMTGEESIVAGDYILPCVSVAKTATLIEL